MYRSILVLILGLLLGFLRPVAAFAVPSQYGASGLFSQPTADTLNSGSLCLGVWTNSASNTDGNALVVPVAITLGLGSFIEAYGSYPNLLFNGDEPQSGRGFANIGFKLRLIGDRAAPFKVALDGQLQRSIADDPALDGLTNKLGRVVVSFKPGKFGFHLSGGYSANDSPLGESYKNQALFGGGLEFSPTYRMRLIGEYETSSEKISGVSGPAEAMLGFQYFFSPHLTLNFGVGGGFSDASPDWRTLIGFTSCQGVGTYIKPVPRAVLAVDESPDTATEKVRVVKVRTLSSLVPKVVAPQPQPVSSYEVPVTPNSEEVTINPSERLTMPTAGLPAALPVAAVAPAAKTGRSFQLFDVLASDDGVEIGRKIVDDPRYQANFVSIKEFPEYFQLIFFHRYTSDLPVWIEGDVKYTLSTQLAHPLEDVELKVFRVNGNIPPFNLHLGEHSEVFSFELDASAAPEKNSPLAPRPAPAAASPAASGSSTLGKIAKGVVLAPVAIVAAPFVGIGYLVSKVIGTPTATVTATAGTAVATSPSTPAAPAEPLQPTPLEPTSAAADTVPTTVESTPAMAPVPDAARVMSATAVAPLATAAPLAAPAPTATAVSAASNSVAVPAMTTAAIAIPTATASVLQPQSVTGAGAAPSTSAAPLALAASAPTLTPADGRTLTGPVAAATAGATPTATASVVQPPSSLPVTAVPPALATPSGATLPFQPAQPVRPAPANLAFDKPMVAVVYRKFRLPSFTFGFDEWSLSEEGKRALSEVAEELRKEKRWFFVRIDGYTDNIGSSEYNYNLGLRRAIAAASYLVVNTGFDPALLFVKSTGEAEPVATNDSEIGRMQNRRIELLILVPKTE